MKKLFISMAAAMMTLTTALGMGVGTANASAYGCAFGNGLTQPNTYCVGLVGTGTFVNYVQGWFNGGTLICNWYITAEFFDSNWNWYQTLATPTNSCTTSASRSININAYKKQGYMCSSLRFIAAGTSNWQSLSRCFAIHS